MSDYSISCWSVEFSRCSLSRSHYVFSRLISAFFIVSIFVVETYFRFCISRCLALLLSFHDKLFTFILSMPFASEFGFPVFCDQRHLFYSVDLAYFCLNNLFLFKPNWVLLWESNSVPDHSGTVPKCTVNNAYIVITKFRGLQGMQGVDSSV